MAKKNNRLITMKIVNFAILASTIIFLSGCSTTQPFNPGNRVLTFEEGKPYLVPYSSTFKVIDSRTLYGYSHFNIQHDCKLGDLQWTSTEYAEYAMTTLPQTASLAQLAEIIRAGFNQQIIGCTAELSDKEYEYYRDKEMAKANQQSPTVVSGDANKSKSTYVNCITNYGFTHCSGTSW